MQSLEAELERARDLDERELADAIEAIGFECTRCGACCKSESEEPHTATVFPDEVRRLQRAGDDRDGSSGGSTTEQTGASKAEQTEASTATDEEEPSLSHGEADGEELDWRDVARPMPYGLADGDDGTHGETFEWALQTDACGDCAFYAEDDDGVGACTVHDDRPLICETYPFSVALGGTSQPMGEAVDAEGLVRAHECEGLGRDIDRADAESLASALKARAVTELEEAIGVRDAYEPRSSGQREVVVHDSEGAKRPDGSPLGEG